jgi:hypothetical protein
MVGVVALVCSLREQLDSEPRAEPRPPTSTPLPAVEALATKAFAVQPTDRKEREHEKRSVDVADVSAARAGVAGRTRGAPSHRRSRKATPAYGRLRVAALLGEQPLMAEVYIDGRHAGQSPLQLRLSAGRHQVEARKKGLRPVARTVALRPGRTTVAVLGFKGGSR